MTFSDPVTDIGTVGHIFINLIAWDQGNKEWWKVDAKEKEKKNSKKNPKVYWAIRQRYNTENEVRETREKERKREL